MYSDQKNVARRLNIENRRAMRRMEDAGSADLKTDWQRAKSALKGVIAHAIVNDFASTQWDAQRARQSGTLHKIHRGAQGVIDAFLKDHHRRSGVFLKHAKFEEMTRTVWAMSQMLPPNVKIHLPTAPHEVVKREAFTRVPKLSGGTGVKATAQVLTGYQERMNGWMGAYRDNLVHNLHLGAMNRGTLEDALSEVEATRVGSPNVSIDDVIERIFRTEFLRMTMGPGGGHDDAIDANPDAPITEVWRALSDGRVCEDCAAQDGKTRAEVDSLIGGSDYDIPLHPYCRCWWGMEPAPWAEVSGETTGHPKTTMVIRDADGGLQGVGVIEYSDWIEPNLHTIIAARKAAGIM